ncbi:MAG: hydrogenase maturation nickel metallochaperone HypA [Actinomycetota bacterium]|nr:hydrogenase maturation nickel metallochaperone HypA [Actinomycetota bacterium]
MHELSVVESMVSIVLKHAETNHASRVEKINLVLGEASSVVEEPVRFYFELLSKETIAEGADLNFRKTPFQASCNKCGKEFHIEGIDFSCPSCGSSETTIVSGSEFQVESIEIS